MKSLLFSFLLLPFFGMTQTNIVTKYKFNGRLSEQDKEVVIKYIKQMPLLTHASFCREHNCMYTVQFIPQGQTNLQASLQNIKSEYQSYVISTTVIPPHEMHACESDKGSRIIIIKK